MNKVQCSVCKGMRFSFQMSGMKNVRVNSRRFSAVCTTCEPHVKKKMSIEEKDSAMAVSRTSIL